MKTARIANADTWIPRTRALTLSFNTVSETTLLFGAVVVLGFLICFVSLDARPAIALSLLTIGGPGLVAASRFRQSGVIDALGLFCIAFVAYNGVTLLRLASMPESATVPYPWSFTQDNYTRAGLLGALAAATICGTSLLLDVISRSRGVMQQISQEITWLVAGLAMYVAGLAMYFVQWQQAGGYLAGLKAGRSIRFEVFGSSGLSWPYTAFVIPGLAAMWHAASTHRSRAARWTAWIAFIVWCALLLPQGDRLYVLEALIAVVAVHCIGRRQPVRLTGRRAAAVLLIYFLSAIFGEVRSVVAPLATGEMSRRDAELALGGVWNFDWLKPEHSELAGPYFSVLQVVSEPSEELLEGKDSYSEALLAVLPRALYPGEKPMQLARRFEMAVHRGRGTTSGWGFSPVAEAFLNLKYAGVVLIFMLWTVLFHSLDALKQLPRVGAVLFAVMLPEVVNANRMDFRNVYGESLYYLGGVALTFVLAELLSVFFQKTPQNALR